MTTPRPDEDSGGPPTDHGQLIEFARDQAAAAAKPPAVDDPRQPPRGCFPGYLLIDEIHRGGQSVVYEAVDERTQEPVALKVMLEGLFAGTEARARFRREARLLQEINHPNIVRVRDSGEADGHCYIVQDLVVGLTLDAFVKERQLGLRAILALFAKVCDAVHEAHLRTIIHRDLKPSNIRVTEDGEPVILDFGLAKALGESDAGEAQSVNTVTGRFMGSVPWTSPEQVQGGSIRADVRTDVYALGVILFHLLTGRFPYGVHGTPHETMDNIVSAEPTRPGAVRTDLDDEIDTIVLKCLQKDPMQRYQSAAALAEDLRRYLAGQPIAAKGDSPWYRWRKFCRRRRGLVVAVGLLFGAAVAFGPLMLILYAQQVQATRRAQLAEHRAREAIEYLITDVSNALMRFYGANQVRRDILQNAYDRLRALIEQRGEDPILLADQAETLSQLGGLALGLGRLDEAEQHLEEALSIHEALLAGEQTDPDIRAHYSINLVRLGNLAQSQGQEDLEFDYYERALRIDEDLHARHPDNRYYADNLTWSYERVGVMLMNRGELGRAADLFSKRLDLTTRLVASDPEDNIAVLGLCSANFLMSRLADKRGDPASALAYSRAWLAAVERLLELEPDNPKVRDALSFAWLNTGRLLKDASRPDEARQAFEHALQVAEQLVAIAPSDGQFHERRINALMHFGRLALTQGDIDQAHEWFERAFTAAEEGTKAAPQSIPVAQLFANAYRGILSTAPEEGDSGSVSPAKAKESLMSLVQRSEGRLEMLIRISSRLMGSDPDFETAPSEALEVAELAARASGGQTAEPLWVLALAVYANGDAKRAREILDQAEAALKGDDQKMRRRIAELRQAWGAAAAPPSSSDD